jgi:membrane protease YdiL (CAAX protease family)
MGFIAVTLICLQSTPDVFWAVVSDFSESPSTYIVALLSALGFFFVFLVSKGVPLSRIQGLWIVYLLYISIVEELAFRLFLPMAIEPSAGFLSAIVMSNFLFALLHYFTLRWKWKNCVFVFLGGLGLSRLLENSGDLALLVLVHFVATFLNTPSQPGTSTIAKDPE